MDKKAILVRYTSRNYALSVLDGHFYLNSLTWFSSSGDAVRGDWAEGADYAIPFSEAGYSKEMVSTFPNHEVLRFREGYEYLHIYCFSMILEERRNARIALRFTSREHANQFGDTCLVFADPDALFSRIISRCDELGYMAFFSKVTYAKGATKDNVSKPVIFDKPILNTGEGNIRLFSTYPPFRKAKRYKDALEYRLLVLPSKPTAGPIQIDIGSIKDIAYCCANEEMNPDEIYGKAPEGKIHFFFPDKTKSNCNLEELIKRACAWANNKTHNYFIIGGNLYKS